jgi:hypothetical protein
VEAAEGPGGAEREVKALNAFLAGANGALLLLSEERAKK